MKTNSEIRALARQSLSGNWTMPVVVTLLLLAITGGSNSIPYVGFLLSIFLLMPINFSVEQLFLRFVRGEKEGLIGKMFDCFNCYGRALGVKLLMTIFVFLWSLLFCIPGIIKSYSYAMTYYIALDNPELGANACIERSMKMMKGHKGRLFLLDLSFIGWILLGLLTLGIGLLWVIPYMKTARSHFYEELKAAEEVVAPAE